MLNQLVIVGRMQGPPRTNKKGVHYIKLSCPRAYKNDDGDYDVDIISVTLSDQFLETITNAHMPDDSLLGIKGLIHTDDDGLMYIQTEKVTFLSSQEGGDK